MDQYIEPAQDTVSIAADDVRALKERYIDNDRVDDDQTFIDILLTLSGEKHGTSITSWWLPDPEGLVEQLSEMGGRLFVTDRSPPDGFGTVDSLYIYLTIDEEYDEAAFLDLVEDQGHRETALFLGYPEEEVDKFMEWSENGGRSCKDPSVPQMNSPYAIAAKYGRSMEDVAKLYDLMNYMIEVDEEAVDRAVEMANRRYELLEALEDETDLEDGYLTDTVDTPEELARSVLGWTKEFGNERLQEDVDEVLNRVEAGQEELLGQALRRYYTFKLEQELEERRYIHSREFLQENEDFLDIY